MGGSGAGLVPIPTALIGGRGAGLVPIPTVLMGGNGAGLVPIPATPFRIETPLNTTKTAKANARKRFFTVSPPVPATYKRLTGKRA